MSPQNPLQPSKVKYICCGQDNNVFSRGPSLLSAGQYLRCLYIWFVRNMVGNKLKIRNRHNLCGSNCNSRCRVHQLQDLLPLITELPLRLWLGAVLYSTAGCTVLYSTAGCTVLYCWLQSNVLYCWLHCTVLLAVLYCTVLLAVLYCTAGCTVLYCWLHSNVLYCWLHCTVMYCWLYCTVLYCTAHGNTRSMY